MRVVHAIEGVAVGRLRRCLGGSARPREHLHRPGCMVLDANGLEDLAVPSAPEGGVQPIPVASATGIEDGRNREGSEGVLVAG